MSSNTKFIWTDGSADELSAAEIGDNFATKYGKQKPDLKEVIIGDKVKTIASNAFKMCKNLEKVTMSQSVKEIGVFAFGWCEKLEEIVLPEGLETVSISMFTFCASLKKAYIPDSVTLIDDEAFSFCPKLEDIELPANLNCIYTDAFISCTSLTHLKIPAKTEIIDGLAFANCEGLKTLEIEDGSQLKDISASAFSSCINMDIVNVEALTKLTSIGDHAFEACHSLTSFVFPEGLKYLGAAAFKDCFKLSGDLVIPPTLKKLGNESFANCISLNSVKFIPREKYVVSAGLFAACEKLSEVTGLNNASEVQACAFMGCTVLKAPEFGENLTSIGEWAFKGCIAMNITIPDSVTSIGKDAFAYTESISYEGKAEGAPWGAASGGPLNIATVQYFTTEGRLIPKENQLKLITFDLLWYLQYIHKQKIISDELFEKYESGIFRYIRGDDNEYILVNLLEGFDEIYGTQEFPLNADVEKFRDRMYICLKELG